MPGLNRWFLRPQPFATPEDLADFLAGEAAFVSQKCTVEYCRARSGLLWDKLFKEPVFVEALRRCQWESYAAVLEDLAVIAEGRLRPFATEDPERLRDALVALCQAVLGRHPLPAHRGGTGWQDAVDQCRRRLAQAALAPPAPAFKVGETAGRRVWALLPIHDRLRSHDRELIANNIRVNLCQATDKLDRRLDGQGLAAALLGSAAGAARPVPYSAA